MAKGYSFQGLVDSVLMKLNLLSEIKEQGKKAQKEARDNLDVYGKEQTYNKLETDNHISLVVDNAPSTLNTLNKLAKAISNNPKFAEKLHLLLDQKLAKSDNGADIPDKNLFVKNLGLTETVDCAKNALDKRTGGTINGNIISLGTQILLQGNDRKHLGFHNQDGSVRMWLYKDKGGDGVHLNNGNDGGGDWLFHKNGNFHAPASIVAGGGATFGSNITVSWGGRTATFQENGDVVGPIWGGALSAWLNNQLNSRGTKNIAHKAPGGWWKCGDTGLMLQWGRESSGNHESFKSFPTRFSRECFSVVLTPQGGASSNNTYVSGYSADGFKVWTYNSGAEFLWFAIGE